MMTRADGSASQMRRTVSTPSSPGIMMSISTKSGFRRLYSVIASFPLAASLARTFSKESINRLRWNRANAESSTIRHVIGLCWLDPRSVALSIFYLRGFRLARRDNEPVRDVRERANLLNVSPFNSGPWHPEYRAGLLVLCDRVASGFSYLSNSLCTIGPHSGQDHCRRMAAIFRCHRAK